MVISASRKLLWFIVYIVVYILWERSHCGIYLRFAKIMICIDLLKSHRYRKICNRSKTKGRPRDGHNGEFMFLLNSHTVLISCLNKLYSAFMSPCSPSCILCNEFTLTVVDNGDHVPVLFVTFWLFKYGRNVYCINAISGHQIVPNYCKLVPSHVKLYSYHFKDLDSSRTYFSLNVKCDERRCYWNRP